MLLMIWKCSGYGSRSQGVKLYGFVGGELVEPGLQGEDLFFCCFAAVDLPPYFFRIGKPFEIPPDMLAGGAHTCVLTIELVVIFQMVKQAASEFAPGGWSQVFSRGEIMTDLTENPRPALCGAADHHRIGARIL